MIKEDALLYFPFRLGDDIDDLYEDLLFEQKQFFANRMPISKVFNSRLLRLKKIEDAYIFFGGKRPVNDTLTTKIEFSTSDSIHESYNNFQANLNHIKLELFNSKNVNRIANSIDLLFKNQQHFAEKFNSLELSYDSQPVISKEPDAIEMISAIESAKELGITNFKELYQLPPDNILVQEANRLSLWLKLETNV